MKDERKTKKQLIKELQDLRKKYEEFENGDRKIEDKFEVLFENSPDGFYLYDSKGNFVYGNRAAEKLTAYKRAELIGKNFLKLKLLSPNQKAKASKLLAKSALGKSTGPDEFTLNKKNGTQVDVEILTQSVKVGKRSFILGTIRDITQRKFEEKALKESEEKLSNFMNSASDSFYLLDSDLNFIEINKKGLEIIGKKKNEVIGKNIADIVPDVKSSGRYEKHMEVLRTGKPFTIDHFVPHPKFGDRYFILNSFKVGDGIGVIATDITDRKLAEEALLESEERYRLLFETANDAIFIMKYDKFIDCNPKTLEMFGRPLDQIINRTPADLSPPKQRDGQDSKVKAMEKIKAALRGEPQFFEWVHTRQDGGLFDVEVNLKMIEKKKEQYLFAIVRDITDRKRAERALRESEERFRVISENALETIWEIDAYGKYTYVNPVVEQVMGYKPEEILGRRYDDFVHPDDKKELQKTFNDLFPKKQAFRDFENRQIHRDGHTIWLSASGIPILDKSGNLLGYRGLNSDISNIKQVEKALRESEEKYRKIFELSPEAIVILDQNGVLLETNNKNYELFGSSSDEIIGKNFMELPYFNEDTKSKIIENFTKRIKGEEIAPYEIDFITKSGKIKIVRVVATIIKDQYTNQVQNLVMISDITEQKKVEQDLIEKEQTQRALLNAPIESAILVDLEGKILAINEIAAQRLGKPVNELIGLGMDDYLPPELTESRKRYRVEITKNKKPVRFQDERIGRTYDNSLYPVFDPNGEVNAIAIYAKDITEKVKAEEALQKSEERLRIITENALEWIWEVDIEGKYTYVNPVVEKILGYTPQQLLGNYFYDYFHPDDIDHFKNSQFPELVKNESFRDFENRQLHKNGKAVWLLTSGIPMRDDEGNTLGFRGVNTDITARKLAEQALMESEQRFRNVIQASPMGIFIYELEAGDRLVFRNANPAADKILGVDNRQFIGKTIEEAFPPLKETEVPMRYRRAAAFGERWYTQQIEYEHGSIAGVYEVWAFQTRPNMMACMFQDITDRKKAEEALQQSEQKYRKMFEMGPEAILLMDNKGVLLEANERMYQMFGSTPEENVGKHFLDLPHLTPESRAETLEMFSRRLKGEEIPPYEIDYVTSKGEKGIGQILASVIKNKEGEIVQELAMVRDITERKWTERLTESQRDLAQALGVAMTLEDALVECFHTAIAISGMEVGGVYILQKTTGNLALIYSMGISPEYKKAVVSYTADHPYTRMVMEGKPSYMNYSEYLLYIKKDPVRLKEGLKVLAIVPILFEGQVVACLNMASRIQQEISDLTRQALETIAVQIGAVIVRIKAQEAVMASEERYRTLQENIPIGIFRSLPTGKVISGNPTMLNMFGLDSEKDFETISAEKLYKDPERRNELLNQLREKGEVTGFEAHLRRKDDLLFWGSLNVKAVHDEKGEFIHMDGMLEDITERKRSAEAIRRAKDEWERTFDTVPEFISIVDKDFTIRRINKSMATKLGLKPQEAVGKTCYQVVHGTDLPPGFCPHVKLLKDGKEHTIEAFDQHLGGDYIINVTPMHSLGGELTGAVHTAIDISERKWFEDLTRHQRDLARSLSVTMNLKEALDLCLRRAIRVSGMDSGGVYLVDDSTGSLDLAFALGLSSGFIKAASHYDPDSPNTRLVMQGKPVYQVYEKFKDSTSITVKHIENLQVLAVVPVLYKKEVVACLNIGSHNLDQISGLARQALETIAAQMGEVIVRIRAEGQLQATTKQLKALTSHLQEVREKERIQIARELHDELSSMLTVLKMGIVKIADKIINFSDRDEFKEIINKTVSMEEMINKSVDLVRKMITRLRPGILDDLGLLPAIEWLIEEFGEDSGISCNLISDVEQLDFDPDESTAIFRILQEILTNIARHAKASKVDVNIIKVKGQLKLEVEDNGRGIRQSDIDQKESFGIIGIRERANLYNWNFKIKGIRGKGTFVRLTVPLKRKEG
jgi:PAS domain S-box-containing protein